MNEIISKNRPPELYFLFILGFTLNFALWFADDNLAEPVRICSRFFQGCENYSFFVGFPESYDTSIFYFTLFVPLVFSVYFYLNGKQKIALNLLIYPLVMEALFGFVLYENSLITCLYYQFFPCLIFLFSKDFKNDLKWLVPLFYFFASWIKLDSGWLLGKIFATPLGLPLFPNFLMLPAMWLLFFMELTAFALLSKSQKIHKFYLYFFFSLHFYAFILTGYHFQIMALPLVYFTFRDGNKVHKPSPLFFVLAVYLVVVNLLPHITDSNFKSTGQGDALVFDMVDAHRHVISLITIVEKNGSSRTVRKRSLAFEKQVPYKFWMQHKKLCTEDVKRIGWTFEQAMNHGPMKKIVDVEDLCTLKFDPFFKNDWIKAEGF